MCSFFLSLTFYTCFLTHLINLQQQKQQQKNYKINMPSLFFFYIYDLFKPTPFFKIFFPHDFFFFSSSYTI